MKIEVFDLLQHRRIFTFVAIISLLCVSWPVSFELNDASTPSFAGPADRIVIDSPPAEVTADEVVQFEAIIYDAVNNVVTGQVNWTVSNGSISSNGLFFPWASGSVEIIAEHNGLNGHYNLTVTPGAATSIEISTTHFMVKETTSLQADLLDARGNREAGGEGMVWDLNGLYFGHGMPEWTPEKLGDMDLRVRFNQLEDNAEVTVVSGDPHTFSFLDRIQVRAGATVRIVPDLIDINGYSMPLSTIPSIAWYAENGTFNAAGDYTATNTGRWNISATYGNITGEGIIEVIPGDAVASELIFVNSPTEFVAGEQYELAVERRDANGYIGTVSLPLSAWTVNSGGLSTDDNRVYWNPSGVGPATLSVMDNDVYSERSVEVLHGTPMDLEIMMNPALPSAGDQVALILQAVDVMGNTWIVNGSIEMNMGNETEIMDQTPYLLIQAQLAQSWRFEASWYDEVTAIMFVADHSFDVHPGPLAFITMDGEGEIVPADGDLNLNPQFFDAYGNQLPELVLNWTIDGNDITLDMLLNDGRWVATSLGGHEIRVNADGVFATVRLTVVAGDAHGLVTDVEEGFTVVAGVPTDMFVQVVDIHGNLAEATQISTTINGSVAMLEASPTGLGYWQMIGKQAGDHELVMVQDEAIHSVSLKVVPGKPIRIQSNLNQDFVSQGDVVLLQAYGIDAYGNSVPIDETNASVTCTAGTATFVTNGIWEIDVTNDGTDRACTLVWDGLLAQNFFDVESVLLGGAVGSTNTAMVMGIILLSLILAVLVVLTKKANEEGNEWIEDAFDEDEYDSNGGDEDDDIPDDDESELSRHGLTDAGLKELAAEATRVGVMQATPSTKQGQTGWYVDVSEELQYWEVTPAGEWIRHESEEA